MEFPDVDRVIYRENPLAEVVCQIRFPRILAIDERLPAEFQERIGENYPFVETQEVTQFSLGVGEQASPALRTHYVFRTEDEAASITLCSEYVSIRTERYERWERFKCHIEAALEALHSSYSVGPLTRIGLRYIDLISRDKLGLQDEKWSDLVRSAALGLLAEPDVPIESVEELRSATVIQLDGGGKVAVRTGLAEVAGATDEQLFLFDCDFFETNRTKGVNHALEICDEFNRKAGKAFRWVIRDRLHDALGPTSP